MKVNATDLSVNSTRRKEVRLDWVKVNATNGACMRLISKNQGFALTVRYASDNVSCFGYCGHILCICYDLGRIPYVELAIFHASD